jgi:hypothetical protein
MDRTVMTRPQHGARIGLLMMGTALLLGWTFRHAEASFADGLRYIRQAQEIDHGAWRDGLVGGIDHPLHPLGLVAARGLVGGEGPVSWQRAAVALACASIVLLTIPVYLLARDAFGEAAAWLGCALFMAHPLIGSIAVNALSESTFLLFWTWGLWTAVRYLREGRFAWLPPTIGFGVLAYLSRPEGMLLPLAMFATLLLLPLHRSTRIHWPRWWYAVGFLAIGSLLAAGPFVALKGGLGTKPAIARVLGLAPESPPDGLERERPLPPGQTRLETYRLATERMARVIRGFVSTPLLPLAILGLVMLPRGPERARTWLFLGVLILASAVGLVRLHATGGYCTLRHGLVPGMLLVLAAAHGLSWLMARVSIPGNWLGLGKERLMPGPAVWALLLALLVVIPRLKDAGATVPGPFHLYRDAGDWLAANTRDGGRVLDLTDWSLFFSGRPGYRFGQVYDAPADPQTRWIVLREPHLEGHWKYSAVVRDLVGQREPVALIPPKAAPGQFQLRVYDRHAPVSQVASSDHPDSASTAVR